MEIKNQFKIQLDEKSKCSLMCDVDMPLGMLYDVVCALKAFVFSKLKEAEDAENAKKTEEEIVQPETNEVA